MTDLRQAAEQALEALEAYKNFIDDAYINEGQWHWLNGLDNAQTALKAALEQQAEALQAMNDQLTTGTSIMLDGKRVDPASVYKKAEPVAVYGYCPDCGAKCMTRERRLNGNDKCINGHTYPSSTALKQQAEPVQEPFGYLWPTGRHPEFRFTQQKRDGADGMPIYTAPPQRKPLTDEEIMKMYGLVFVSDVDGYSIHGRLRFARAVEAAHGIKEGT